MNKYLYRVVNISECRRLDLFDKLITPVLNYSCEVWGFINGNAAERVHMQFCKRMLGVKMCTQNEFIYGEPGRISFQSMRYYNITKYWLKIRRTDSNTNVYKVCCLLKHDLEYQPNKTNWCFLVENLLCTFGVHDAWMMQARCWN